ncbi:hypothetical protein G7072_05305 [Nocardioides sp. HDW12B]|uniref:Gmad2 immunoglobulin-like domain-containing protein n=1 Tax=Nocardioides sp. HDW12B TaxID=2714939 RepID=UPI00140CE989|nr:Gmad2 immunoglobulin-like domain-containing protein [Nocardioides sp. HDW12B]QIK65824.1 hypothetical protein G7072_05305 [Nocardioides sp. HDW12B]
MSDKRPWIYGALGAAVATAATVVAVTVLSDSDDTPVAGSGDPAPSASSDLAEPSGSPEPSESAETSETADPEPSGSAVVSGTVPVYLVGSTGRGLGLYREFQAGEGDDPLLSAVGASLSGASLDPDYSSLWEGLGAQVDAAPPAGDVILLALSGSGPDLAERPDGMSAADARLAVQQLVWTATAALQRDVPVTFEVDGDAPDTLLGVDVTGGVSRGEAMSTLAPVWVTSPQDGDTVGSTFAVEGQGAFFEATVSWQLLDPPGEVVKEGFTTARECCVMSPYRFQVKDVDPGDYTLRVYQADTSGEPGAVETEDTKRLTVE